jgi:UDP-GlcNAc:undecaprenyl-phosphate GlcNAc-1-phosphate transferase
LHYLFLDAGFSQRQAVLSIYLLCIIFGLVGIMGTTPQKIIGIVVLIVVMIILLVGLAVLKKRRSKKAI